ncbi:nuclease, XP-G family protein Ast1 [Schizosaccharomyces osmophilus]|uniref:Nuclease, XP-G family protein Ast1 n=1 Tax=Schizosaccharomyces osmophilus TaxID=2545709 RepID=A0AAE9WGM2_9SCHI|nr:nuclease, XP-G family protein Ast1 [Schizosaccharomyces osmophilus]WBW75358.1 nuclease, XP-G family protein Ast1 [Schizosaccharomyces osmophilus]
MGVPRLGRFLEPFGKVLHFQVPPTGSPGSIVIDGPAFAYWLWFAVSIPPPNYRAFQDAILNFHQFLISLGFRTIEYVFDGGLPYSKHQTRKARYQQNMSDPINAYVHLCVPIAHHVLKGIAGANVVVCNQEADKYCALRARELDGIVLSQDSDLLLFNLENPHTGYVPLHSISITSEGLQGKLYNFQEIKRHLPFDIYLLAAYLGVEGHPEDQVIDYHSSFQQICKVLEESVKTGTLEKLISTQELHRVHKFYLLDDISLSSQLNDFMWGRVQELLHSTLEPPEMWLPQLPELPARPCSWTESAPLRLQAYANFFSNQKSKTEVLEYSRKYAQLSKKLISIKFDYASVIDTMQNKFANWPLPHRLVLWTLRCLKNLTNIAATSFLLMHTSLYLNAPLRLQSVTPTQEGTALVSRYIATSYSLCMLVFSESDKGRSIDLQSFSSFSPLSSTVNFCLFHEAMGKLKTGRSPFSIVSDRATAELTYKLYKDLSADYQDMDIIINIWNTQTTKKKRKKIN